jgi:hypothetical protein
MASKDRLLAAAASLTFSAIAVWFVLFNGRFTSDGAPLAGYELLVFICICVVAALIFATAGAKSFKHRASLGAVAVAVGVAMPVLVIAVPLLFCLIFQCRGFDWL